jgi:DnaJ family protein C protein 1
VTGLESKRLISDDCLEVTSAKNGNDNGDDDGDSDDETSSENGSVDDDGYVPYKVATKEDYVPVEIKSKKKTKGGKMGDVLVAPPQEDQEQQPSQPQQVAGQDGWTQTQQKALEAALQQFPKGTAERWDRIASKVSGKTKEECMIRVRYLAEAVKKKKEGDCVPATGIPAAS